MPAPVDSNGLPGILCDIVLSFGLLPGNQVRLGNLLLFFSISALLLTQYIDSLVSSLVFSIPM